VKEAGIFLCESFPANTHGGHNAEQIVLGNLAYSVSNHDLEELFSQVGQVQSAAVIADKLSGQSKGLWLRQDVECGRSNQGHWAVKVSEAKPRESGFGGSNRNGGGDPGRDRS
jgi:hypothetical protein